MSENEMNRLAFGVVGCSAGLFLFVASTAAQVLMPHRKPGMWETTMTMAGREMKTGLCIDEATDAKMSVFGQQVHRERCGGQGPTISPIPGGFAFHSTCSGRVTSGSAIGDFNRAYTVTVDSDKSHMIMNSRWVGPCPPGRKPGDMVLPNGMVMNMNSVN